MGAIGGLLGVNGGAGGTGFAGPAAPDQTGMNNLNQSYNQLQNVAQGQGPNPAMMQYNQNVQNLAKQQSGAISSVQGISPALAARLATQQGSAALQNAAAQGATAQSEQQLGAMGAAGNIAGMQANAANQMQSNINNVNSAFGTTTMNGTQNMIGGLMNAAGAGSKMAMAGGGMVPMAGGGVAGPQSGFMKFLTGVAAPQFQADPGSMSGAPNNSAAAFKSGGGKSAAPAAPQNAGQGPTVANAAGLGGGIPYATPMAMSRGGSVPAMVSPGELRIPAGNVPQVAAGKNPMEVGERIPGKPKVKGNSYANDVVPKRLNVGDVIIPNSVMQSKNPPAAAMKFVQAVMAKKGKKK